MQGAALCIRALGQRCKSSQVKSSQGGSVAQKQSRRVTITISDEVHEKIQNLMQKERLPSFSLAAARLLHEALDQYPELRQQDLPFYNTK